MSKAALYTVNANAQTVAAGGSLALGTIARRFGNTRCCTPVINLAASGGSISLNECGYYLVTVDVTDAPTAAGAVTVTLYQDGAPVSGAVATNTAAAGSDATSVSVTAIVRVLNCTTSALTAVLTAGAGSVTNVAVSVVKI